MDTDKIIITISTLSGVFLGGIISFMTAYFQQKAQKKRETEKLLLEKIELMYEAVIELKTMSKTISWHFTVFPTDRKKAMEIFNERVSSRFPSDKIVMLAGLYAPTILNRVEQLSSIDINSTMLLMKFIASLETETELIEKRGQSIVSEFTAIERICTDIEKELKILSKKTISR